MIKQPTAEEYDIALLVAKRDLATDGSTAHTPRVEVEEYKEGSDYNFGNEFITKERFFKDLRKASQRIKPEPSPKPSKT